MSISSLPKPKKSPIELHVHTTVQHHIFASHGHHNATSTHICGDHTESYILNMFLHMQEDKIYTLKTIWHLVTPTHLPTYCGLAPPWPSMWRQISTAIIV